MRRRVLLASMTAASLSPREPSWAQQRAIPVVGYLGGGTPQGYRPFLAGFRRGLGEVGYVEGQNVAIEYRWADGRYDRLPALAADLVSRRVDVIAAGGGPSAAQAAKEATSVIPIVFVGGDDAVADGLISSLARPGGNTTGVISLSVDLTSKRLELLCELRPQIRVVALLVNPSNPNSARILREMPEAARRAGVQLLVLNVDNANAIDDAFALLLERRADGLLVVADPLMTTRREQIVALAARHAVPAIYGWREFAVDGGLMSFGPSLAGAYRQIGNYAGQILKGTRPGDLPVIQPTTFELVVNMKTAKALGLTIPLSILARADEIIE